MHPRVCQRSSTHRNIDKRTVTYRSRLITLSASLVKRTSNSNRKFSHLHPPASASKATTSRPSVLDRSCLHSGDLKICTTTVEMVWISVIKLVVVAWVIPESDPIEVRWWTRESRIRRCEACIIDRIARIHHIGTWHFRHIHAMTV